MSYELLNWEDDQDITADRLNHMDSGIKNTNDSMINKNEKGVSVATLVDGKIPINQLPENIGGNIDTSNLAKLKEDNIFTGANTFNVGIIINDYILSNNAVLRIKSGAMNNQSGNGFTIQTSSCGIYDWTRNKYVLKSEIGNDFIYVLTPETNNDEDIIATCKFVKSQSASMDTSLLSILNQCYKKDPSGLIHQFIELEATTDEIDIQFPISFPEKCLFVGVEILNPQKDSSVCNIKFETIEKTLDSVKLLKVGTGTPTISVMAVGI